MLRALGCGEPIIGDRRIPTIEEATASTEKAAKKVKQAMQEVTPKYDKPGVSRSTSGGPDHADLWCRARGGGHSDLH